MRHAETLLLIDDEQAEVTELHVLREQSMRPDNDLDLASLEILERLFLFGLRSEAADHVDAHREGGKSIPERLLMLKGQDGCGREDGDLLAVHDRLERGAHRHLGLAVADIAAEQAIHRGVRLHVPLDVGDGVRLIDRELPLERILEFLLPVRIGRKGIARHRPARGVELEQLLGHVAHGFLHARLGLLPRRPAQAVERRARGTGVLLNEIEPLDRDEELVFSGVAQLHELLRRQANVDSLEADEHTDPVVHVHHEVVDLQVSEIRQKGSRGRSPAFVSLALLFEDVRLCPELKACFRQPEPARQMPHADKDGGRSHFLRSFDRSRIDLVVGEDFDGALGTTGGVRDEDHRVAGFASAADLGHPVGHTTGEFERRLTGNVHGLFD